ncbi:response regulator transcription factor [Acidipropionibacterium jensenii]|uniref:response regulator transcription factor n=1 Tax=Acidipropionibacterium jensenii TaxID=1749 RepID=UPI000BEF1669|nr:helix-turn-helix transcriptional regulator [Acidipropionibacterium jensenii]MDN6557556.1 helix-turn-helix transcriptional regulator [Acidipropionibacterium acidipropionici]AZZ43003.1 LuxR family transcriptional regulator [Acidipropionibacterium jensenii]MDN5978028.1 helix-turn-helix transcriptional regulator [Acidipropionibacterium jensenii]MDN5995978.1 helix-turn-helix transcriptional regulator [Acidipropionibacterium jensenii]MDN6021686.1 helix-turn-helix transcriptional regulator [Acidip
MATNTEPVFRSQEEGRELSAREAQMLALICEGATNDEIASICYLTINSVKAYIRNAYRKIGVGRRSQTIVWGSRHGMVRSAAQYRSQPDLAQ